MRNFLLIGLTLLMFSCNTMRKKESLGTAPAEAKQEYVKARGLFKKREWRQAESTLIGIVQNYRKTETADDALFLLAKIYTRQEMWKKAYNVYANVYDSEIYSPREFLARTSAAKILTYKVNRPKHAISLIEESMRLRPNPRQRADLLEVKFDALMKSGSQLEAFETLVVLAEKHPVAAKRSSFRRKAKSFLDSRLSGPELKDFANDSSESQLKTDAMYRYAVHLIEQGEYREARMYLNRVIRDSSKSYVGEQARQLIEQLESRDVVNPRTVGVLLPLSGKFSNIGYQTLWGIQLALGIKGGVNKNNVRLAVIDTQGKPDLARRGIKRLVEKNHAIAVVGGLLGKTAYAASIQAQELGVPFIALSQKEGLTEIGPFIFRNALTVEAQITRLVQSAMKDLNAKTFAVLYPNNPRGTKLSNIFWKTVKENGGTVTGAQSYLPGETDFKEPVQKLVGTYYIEDRNKEYKKRLKEWYEKQGPGRRRKKPPIGLLPPLVDFDALFVPDGPRTIGQIAPMLAYNDVANVYLLGTNVWNSKEFVRRGQNFVSKSLFTDSYYIQDEKFVDSEFFRHYKKTYGRNPSGFSLQGFDTGLILKSALGNSVETRIEFSNAIKRNSGIRGAMNKLALNHKKEFVRPIVTLTVKEGQIIPLEVQ